MVRRPLFLPTFFIAVRRLAQDPPLQRDGGKETALSEKMPIFPKLNHAIRLPNLLASGNWQILPADDVLNARLITKRDDVTCCRQKPCNANFRSLLANRYATRNSTNY
jgi:hypothetical protein